MTVITITSLIPGEGADNYWNIGVVAGLLPTSADATSIIYTIHDAESGTDTVATLTGTFADFDSHGVPQTGTITGFQVVDAGQIMELTGINGSLANFFAAVHANDAVALQAEWFAGADTFNLTANNDVFAGFGGNDTINTGAGNDSVSGRDGDDVVYGESGDDSLYGGFGNDTVYGGDNNDVIFGGRGTDTLYGGDGSDLIGIGHGLGSIAAVVPNLVWSFATYTGEASPDVVDGGAGFDMAAYYYLYDANSYTVNISNGAVTTAVLRNGAAFGSIVNVEALTAQGGVGFDAFTGGAFADGLNGGAGNDTLVGNGGNDTLNGESGDDTLTGGAGNDTLNGGTGIDTAIYSGARSDYIFNWNGVAWQIFDSRAGSPEGADTLIGIEYVRFSDVPNFPMGGPPIATNGDDTLATSFSTTYNVVFGLDGNDTITAPVGSSNSLIGGEGNDTITGGSADDQIDGGNGADTLNTGGPGGNNIINGGAGNDVITGIGSAASVLNGEIGNDQVTGDGQLIGSFGDDILTDTANAIVGTLDGGPGNDTLNGDGALTFATYAFAPDSVTIDLGLSGTAQNTGSAGNDTLNNIRNITGSGYDDVLTGDASNNILNGLTGNDVVSGMGGNDTIIGGFGDDVLDGGDGIDTLSYSGMTVGVEIDLGITGRQDSGPIVGFDTVSNFENVTGANFNDILDGDEGANVLTGLGGVDDLDGNGGDDSLNGGTGNDFLNGGAGTDTAVFSGARALYTVTQTAEGYTVSSAAEGFDTLTGIERLQFSDQVMVLGAKETATVELPGFGPFHGDFGIADYAAGSLLHADPRQFIVLGASGETYTIIGKFTGTDGQGYPAAGTVTEIHRSGPQTYDISAITVDLVQFKALALAADEAGFRALVLGGADLTIGSLGNDLIYATGGDDAVYDPSGSDTLVLSGVRAAYTITESLGVVTVSGPDGTDTLEGIEHLKFSDGVTVHLPGSGAVVTVAGGSEDFRWSGLSALLSAPVLSHDAGSVVLDTTDDGGPNTVTLLGTFTAFDANGFPTAGQVTGLMSQDNGGYLMTITGISMDVAVLTAYLADNDPIGLQAEWFSGNDVFYGGDDVDFDYLPGYGGNDSIVAGAGPDRLLGGDGDDDLNGQTGDDVIQGGFGDDILLGTDGNDVLFGGRGTDYVLGGDGNDLVVGSQGVGQIAVAGPTTTWTFSNSPGAAAADVLDGGAGQDLVAVYYQLESSSFTVDISNPAAVFTVLKDGVGFGSVTGFEQLTAQGGFGADSFTGAAMNDTLLGGYGNDVLTGNGGNDSLQGESGDDRMTGGAGNDTLQGGTGLDTAVFSGLRANYNIGFNATTGTATVTDIRGGAPDGTDTLISVEYLQFSDTLISVLATVQNGGAGDQTLTGLANADVLIGGAGNDTLNGNDGDDSLNGGADNDILNGGNGTDTLDGGAGADTLNGGAGNDTINGGEGNDIITDAGGAADVLNGEFGDDQITADGFLFGSVGNDTLTDLANGIVASLDGGPGDDILIGEGAATTVSYNLAGDAVTVDLRITTAQNTGGSAGTDTITNVRNLTGTGYDDRLTGDNFANTLIGNNGDDVLVGLGGDDILHGLAGDDVMDGGDGVDTANYGSVASGVEVDLEIQDQPQFTGLAGGFDTLIGIENVTGGGFNDQLRGSIGANVLRGGAGNDFLFGDNGDDTLIGDAGNDTLDGDVGIDTVSYAFETTAGVTASLAVTIGQTVSSAAGTDTFVNIENLTGSNLGDTLTGDANANVLTGLSGNDTLNGGDGSDTLIGGAGNDALNGGLGNDTAVFSGARSAYTVSNLGGGSASLTSTAEGVDTANGVETFRFTDGDYSMAGLLGGGSVPARPVITEPASGGLAGPALLVSGTTSPNATVNVFADGTPIGTVTADGAGAWVLGGPDFSSVADGPHNLTAIASNSSGSSLSSVVRPVVVDATAPDAPVITSTGGVTADNTPLLTGTAEAGAEIRVSSGEGNLAVTTADGSGHWSVELPALSDSAYHLTVFAVDAAGNSGAGASIDIDIQASPPAAPVITTPAGTLGGDEVTVTGTAGANLTIDIYVDGVLTTQTTSNGDGDWSVLVDALNEGAVEITAVGTNAAGVTGDVSSPLELVFDQSSQDVVVLTGEGLTNDTTPTLTGTAEAGATVLLLDENGDTLASTTADGSGVWSLTPTLGQGEHTLTINAQDIYGNDAVAAHAVVTVDSVAPGAPAITSTGGVIHMDDYLLTGTTEAGARVQIRDGGLLVAETVADGAGDWAVSLENLTEGDHSLTVLASDEAGNSSGESALNLTVDATGPTLAIVQSLVADTGASATDNITRDGHVVLDIVAAAGSTVKIFDNGVEIGSKLIGAAGTWQFKPNLAAGEHTLTATATKAGAITYSDALATITVDNAGPALAVSSQTLADDTGISATDRITSDGHVTVNGTAEAGATVSLYDGAALVGETVVGAAGEWSFNADLGEGSHRLQAKAVDLAGNTTTSALQSAIVVDKTANAAVINAQTLFADTGASASDNLTNNGKVTLTGTGEAGQVVSIYDGAAKVGSATVTAAGTWSVTTTLTEGVHTLTGEAVDKAGNVTALAAQAPITVDKTAPVSISIDPVAAFTSNALLGLSGQTSEADGVITILRDGVAVDQVTADGSGHWTYSPAAALADAKFVYTARVTDLAGNSKVSAATSVTVDTANPDAPVVTGIASDTGASAIDGLTKDNTLLIKGTAEAGATILVYQDGVQVGSATASSLGAWSFNHSATILADGGYDLTAVAVDKAGNTSPLSGAFHVTIDTAAPTGTSIGVAAHGSAVAANGFTDTTALALSGAAEAGASVAVSATGLGVIGTVVADGAGHWTFDYATAGEGKLTFSARATDLAGNVSASVSQAVTVDLTAPAPELRNSVNAGAFTTLTGVSEAGSVVQVFDGATLLGSATASSAGAWTLKVAKLTDTVHSISLSAVDKAGNVGGSVGFGLVGGTAADTLTGGAARDVLLGAAGADRLDGGAGLDLLTGGTGADTFVFAAGQAQGDLVTDFSSGLDHLEFSGFNIATASLTSLGAGLWQVSDGVVTETLTIQGAVGAGDWLFV